MFQRDEPAATEPQTSTDLVRQAIAALNEENRAAPESCNEPAMAALNRALYFLADRDAMREAIAARTEAETKQFRAEAIARGEKPNEPSTV